MGLPMFQEPDDVIAEDVASKLDRAAAQQRSSIRRQPTVRPGPRYQHSYQHAERDRRAPERRRGEDQFSDLNLTHLEAELERMRSRRVRNQVRSEATDLLRHARDRWDDSEPSRVRRLPWSAATESGLRFRLNAGQSGSGSGSLSAHHLRLLTPSSLSESNRNVPDGSELSPPAPTSHTSRPARLTPGFAPARGPYRESRRPEDERDEIATTPSDSLDGAPPYPRSSARADDGLGDRQRSLSPDGPEEEETWVTLLTTMDDSTRSPSSSNTSHNSNNSNNSSAATSFASSIGRSRSSQNNALATTMTTSFGEIGQTDDGCDLDLPSGITEDHVREIREEHRRERRRQPDGPLSSVSAGGLTSTVSPVVSTLTSAGTVPTGGAQVPGETAGAVQRPHDQRRTRRVELNLFQDILERMQRREEIPDEWWAAVGLTPIS